MGNGPCCDVQPTDSEAIVQQSLAETMPVPVADLKPPALQQQSEPAKEPPWEEAEPKVPVPLSPRIVEHPADRTLGIAAKVTIRFDGKLGMKFDQTTGDVLGIIPGGQAEDVGIQVGWSITQIDFQTFSTDLLMQKTRGNVPYKITFTKESSRPAPQLEREAPPKKEYDGPKTGLRVEFKDQKGFIQTCYFQNKPLGMTFDNKVPVIVDEIEESAAAYNAGVQVGWQFVSVGGVKLEGLDIVQIIAVLKDKSSSLPDAPWET
jgi:predicted metalloprotease with PDZ domain